jgi:hypothetical protein
MTFPVHLVDPWVEKEAQILKDPAAIRLLSEVNNLDRLLAHASDEEIAVTCDVLTLTAAKLIALRAQRHADSDPDIEPALKRQMERAHEQSTKPMSTPESIKRGQHFIVQAREDSKNAIADRIQKGELIPSKELQDRGNISRQSISNAVKEGRLFAIVGPAGANYYPAFYTDPRFDRRSLERIVKQLGSLPATVKFHFFTSKIFSMGSVTPLEALQAGRLDDVLRAATAYAER